MYISGSTDATFGPYPDLCITAPSTCTLGFTYAAWIKKPTACANTYVGIVTTMSRYSNKAEGFRIRCRATVTDIEFRVYMYPQSSSLLVMPLGSGPDVWFYSTAVWAVGSPLKIYENGHWVADGYWETHSTHTREANTQRMMTYGRQFVDWDNGHATAYIDGVRIFNRPLSDAEVLALYNAS